MIKGDLFAAVDADRSGKRIWIPHIVNNQNQMGSGFVVPMYSRWPVTKVRYHKWAEKLDRLGQILIVPVTANANIVHMCAQKLGGSRPLFYDKLVLCMMEVADKILGAGGQAALADNKIICPKFGSERAGGNWDFIVELINDIWIQKGLDITVYHL